MAKVKQAKVTPGTWYIDPLGDIVTDADIVGDVVCTQPYEYDHSMKWWWANVRLLAQAKVMHQLLTESLDVKFDRVESDEWFAKVVEVLEAIQ